MSKADYLLEPAGWMIEAVARLLARLVPRAIPEDPVSEWGWLEWLWMAGAAGVLGALAWMLYRRLRKRTRTLTARQG